MKKHELFIDFDGVILDTITPSYKYMEMLGENPTDEEKKEFFEHYPWKNLIQDKYILNNSIYAIQKLIDSDKFYISVLTHVNSLNEAVIKVKYLRKFFKDLTIIPVPKSISKTNMVHTEDAILVDDYTENLKEWKKAGGIGVKFSAKMKEPKDFPVIDNLLTLIDMF